MALHGQLLIVGGRLLVVGGRLLVIGGGLLIIGGQLLIVADSSLAALVVIVCGELLIIGGSSVSHPWLLQQQWWLLWALLQGALPSWQQGVGQPTFLLVGGTMVVNRKSFPPAEAAIRKQKLRTKLPVGGCCSDELDGPEIMRDLEHKKE